MDKGQELKSRPPTLLCCIVKLSTLIQALGIKMADLQIYICMSLWIGNSWD